MTWENVGEGFEIDAGEETPLDSTTTNGSGA